MEQYAASRRVDDPTALLEKLAGYATDLGLYAEEYAPRSVENFPQAFGRVGFIRAADAVTRTRPRP